MAPAYFGVSLGFCLSSDFFLAAGFAARLAGAACFFAGGRGLWTRAGLGGGACLTTGCFGCAGGVTRFIVGGGATRLTVGGGACFTLGAGICFFIFGGGACFTVGAGGGAFFFTVGGGVCFFTAGGGVSFFTAGGGVCGTSGRVGLACGG